MSWLSIDAVDGALQRTKKTLFEPFSFWKWIKLGIVILLLGSCGGGGGNYYNLGNPGQQYGGEDPGWEPGLQGVEETVTQFLHQYSTFILLGVLFFVVLILLFSYISNVMEFVLVNSLVTDVVSFWEYSGKYMRQGFNLFIIRFVLGLIFLVLFLAAILPVILPILNSPGNIEHLDIGMFLGGIYFFLGVLILLVTIDGIIQSFINLSIPLAMYQDIGIIAAFKKVLCTFKADWGQIIIYWLIRFALRIVVGIIVGIIALILFIIVFGIIFLCFGILLMLTSVIGLGIDSAVFWVIMVPFALVVFVLMFMFSLLVSVPVPVFMKYHMLTFLESWYPESGIPFNDRNTPEQSVI
ncbi:MAG: hypothetical protein KAR85_00760 [Methanosarcinales archaeon]|nr:hypothetical protein [Methanosarcinales archaeon]